MSPSRRVAALAVPAVLALAAACAGDPTSAAPGGGARLFAAPTSPTPPPPPPPVVPEDSVMAGYGSESTGGIEHLCFEYSPETGTEYVASSDSSALEKGLTETCPHPQP